MLTLQRETSELSKQQILAQAATSMLGTSQPVKAVSPSTAAIDNNNKLHKRGALGAPFCRASSKM